MAAASSMGRLRAASNGSSAPEPGSESMVAVPNGMCGAPADQAVPSSGSKRRLTTFQKIFRPWKWKRRRRPSTKDLKVGDAAGQGKNCCRSSIVEPDNVLIPILYFQLGPGC